MANATTEDGLDVSDELTFCLDSSEGFICDGGSLGVGGVFREFFFNPSLMEMNPSWDFCVRGFSWFYPLAENAAISNTVF